MSSLFNIPVEPRLNHRIEVVEGILADEVATMMREFFARVRKGKEEVN